MKRLAVPLCLLSLALPAYAADTPAEAGLSEIRELGRLNGQALACSYAETAARIKALMLKYAPKTRRYGAAYEEATQEAFLAQTREGAACQDGSVLALQADEVARRLQAALPAPAPASK
jgi:hypothetical protein